MDDESELSGEGRESKKGGRPDSNFPLSSFFLSFPKKTDGGTLREQRGLPYPLSVSIFADTTIF